MDDYAKTSEQMRKPLPASPDMRELIRYATLAANGHNTQPWLFDVGGDNIELLPDASRRTPIVDSDDHHLYVSLGCAAENLMIASRATGRPGALTFDPSGLGKIIFDFATAKADAGDLFAAIPARQSTRSDYDGRKVSSEDLASLEAVASDQGVSLTLLTDKQQCKTVLDYVIAGNSAQMDDSAFVDELKRWLRFNASEALEMRDGLFSACSGNPTLPTWIGRAMFGLLFRKSSENANYARQIKSSGGIAVFTGDAANPDHWVKVGQCFQRFALKATALGIRTAHINQPVEVPAVREDFAKWLGAGHLRPDLVIRFGHAPPMTMSLRRPVDDVLIKPKFIRPDPSCGQRQI